MNILDHNFPETQLPQLSAWHIPYQKIGRDIGEPTWDDWQHIRRLLHQLKQPTFFTRDDDFYHPSYRHAGYCVVFLQVPVLESADYVRRVLRHSRFRTKSQRMGKVLRVSSAGISYWTIGSDEEHIAGWTD